MTPGARDSSEADQAGSETVLAAAASPPLPGAAAGADVSTVLSGAEPGEAEPLDPPESDGEDPPELEDEDDDDDPEELVAEEAEPLSRGALAEDVS